MHWQEKNRKLQAVEHRLYSLARDYVDSLAKTSDGNINYISNMVDERRLTMAVGVSQAKRWWERENN